MYFNYNANLLYFHQQFLYVFFEINEFEGNTENRESMEKIRNSCPYALTEYPKFT